MKSHHYILSFDPRDGPDHGLTMDKAQALGERFCAEQFPGHQALVCTHPDGHNHSGNIHVHIVINSLRVAEVERKPYMDRASDTQAGAKHRCTAAAMRHFRAEVMELCQGAGLYQIDLLGGSKNRVTEREYWAQKKGQLALDTEAAAQGKPPTKFETDKEKLRREIRAVLNLAVSFEDFAQRLLEPGPVVLPPPRPGQAHHRPEAGGRFRPRRRRCRSGTQRRPSQPGSQAQHPGAASPAPGRPAHGGHRGQESRG